MRWVWGMLICQEYWWQLQWVLERLSLIAAAMALQIGDGESCNGVPLSILWGNTLKRVVLVENELPGIVGEEWECYPL